MSEIAVITGGTSGIGRATALCLRDAGYDVYELSRREQGVEGLHHIRCDITDEDQVRAAFDNAVSLVVAKEVNPRAQRMRASFGAVWAATLLVVPGCVSIALASR